MDELISDIAASTGMDAGSVRQALGIIVSYLRGEAPAAKIAPLLDQMPGLADLADAQGKIRGGIFGAFTALSGAGLGLGDVQAVAREFRARATERVGAKEVEDVLASVPSLSQFI